MGGSHIFKEFLRMHVVQRQKRARPQVAEEHRHPKAADGDGNDQVEQVLPVKGQSLVEAGLDVPEQVDVTHENQERGQLYQRTRIPLKWPRKQEQERNRKMEDDQAESDDLPA